MTAEPISDFMMNKFPCKKLSRILKAQAAAILIIVCGVVVALAQQTPPTGRATGMLKGVVVDWQYARVLRSCLSLKNKTIEKKVIVDGEGAFEVELPAGTYEVAAQSPHFRKFSRNKLQIQSNITTTLNIMLELAPERGGDVRRVLLKRDPYVPVFVK